MTKDFSCSCTGMSTLLLKKCSFMKSATNYAQGKNFISKKNKCNTKNFDSQFFSIKVHFRFSPYG